MSKVIKAGTYKMAEEKAEVRDLKAYKFAKIVCGDLAKIIPRMQASIQFLEPYAVYSQVGVVLDVMKYRLGILESQYKKYKKIVDTKGRLD